MALTTATDRALDEADKPRLMFLYTYRQRCGNHYVSNVIKALADVIIIGEAPIGNLLAGSRDILSRSAFSERANEWLESRLVNGLRAEFLKDAYIRSDKPSRYVMVKSISPAGLSSCVSAYPDDKHIIVVRDPRDVVASYVKAVNLGKGRLVRRIARRLALLAGYYHWRVARSIRRDVKLLAAETEKIARSSSVHMVSYESLLSGKRDSLRRLSDYIEAELTPQSVAAYKSIQVIGSSFYQEELGTKNKWTSAEPTADFRPIGRWRRLPPLQRLGTIAGLGYAPDFVAALSSSDLLRPPKWVGKGADRPDRHRSEDSFKIGSAL
jgi:hypothetical protein